MVGRSKNSFTDSGILVVNKPQGWSSHDVVAKIRGILGTRKVGHAGTLDPMATGVLVLGVNKATRLLQYILGATQKTYRTTIRLGQATITDDAEGELIDQNISNDKVHEITDIHIYEVIENFKGQIDQVPSKVSAIKINGERSYAKVRSGQDVELASRPVTISRFDITSITSTVTEDRSGQFVPVIDIEAEIQCSSGTYIRALARDIGQILGVGGYLTNLERTQVGSFELGYARSMEEISSHDLLSLGDVAAGLFDTIEISPAQGIQLVQGQRLKTSEIISFNNTVDTTKVRLFKSGTEYAALLRNNPEEHDVSQSFQCIAIVELIQNKTEQFLKPKIVFGMEQ